MKQARQIPPQQAEAAELQEVAAGLGALEGPVWISDGALVVTRASDGF